MLSDQFHCMTGPPRAYFEIPTGPIPNYPLLRCVYTSIRLGSWARREDCERLLIGHAWTQLRCARDEIVSRFGEDMATPLLFWRTMPHIVEEPPTIPGEEEIGGYSVPHREFYRTSLFMRLWVPGAPEFAKLDSSYTQETTYV